MKKIGLIMLVLVALLATFLMTQRDVLLLTMFNKGLESRMGVDMRTELTDGLHLALCGAGGPMPAPNASGACVAVIAGERLFIVDAGTDGLRNLGRMGIPAGDIEAVFLTHFHSDHIDGLGEMATIRWVAAANKEPLPVYGPAGVTTVVEGFNAVYSMDAVYRHAHHGDTVAPRSGHGMRAVEFATPAAEQLTTLLDDGDLKVEVLSVGHTPVEPAVGYRFSYKGRTLVISGDTVASDSVRKAAQGVDLLVHEALAPNLINMMREAALKADDAILAKIMFDIPDYHASPSEAAQIAKDANVGHLLYYHIVPPLVFPGQSALFLDGAQDIFPEYTIGQDGVMFSLPAGSTAINKIRSGL